jgi:alkylation response protein AidB-like acyl-CoA dehydrogenase
VRAAEPLGFDQGLWHTLASTDLLGMAVPEEQGGGGAGLTEVAIVAELLGAHLAPVPVVEAIVATRLIARSRPADSSLLDPLMSGAQLATLALRPSREGEFRLVPGGSVADWVVGIHEDELVLLKVEQRSPLRHNLGSLPLADCVVDPHPVVLANRQTAATNFSRALDEWRTLTAGSLIGLGQRAFQISVDYVKERKAFGRVIGSFQSVAHRLADTVVQLDGAKLLCLEAAWSADQGLNELSSLSSMAFLYSSETAMRCTNDAVHHHGGIGLTMEHDIQLYFRRAKAWPLVLADPRQEYQILADRLFNEPER